MIWTEQEVIPNVSIGYWDILHMNRGEWCSTTTDVSATTPSTTSLYPQPASDRFWLETSFEVSHLVVLDPAGIRVAEIRGQGTVQSLDVSNLPNGIYLVHLFDTNRSLRQVERLLVNRGF